MATSHFAGDFYILFPAADFFFSCPAGFVAEAPDEDIAANLKEPDVQSPTKNVL